VNPADFILDVISNVTRGHDRNVDNADLLVEGWAAHAAQLLDRPTPAQKQPQGQW
jgi:hypothetical protein